MRKAEIEIRWEGPDKPIRAMIEDGLDRLFEELTEHPKMLWADSSTTFTSRVKPELIDGSKCSTDG